MASIQERKTRSGKYYYLAERKGATSTYLGTKPPWPKSQGWKKLSQEQIQRAKRKAARNIVCNSKLETVQLSETPPVYNVWNCKSCDPRFGQAHPGRIPGQAIVNLLLWLTEPFDVVVDPMAGGGTTADVCRYLLRRLVVIVALLYTPNQRWPRVSPRADTA